ncbi:TonB-dependent receptor domain-containing protein [Saccharibacter floricola]|uniref:TonB-dependent receptor domain-containing protein n=1 Tax=Saccharibacter floricola TaxID=231053 RepID=UPI00036D46BA|nr:TonB-dependent receptor [Saccharibacter floricola]
MSVYKFALVSLSLSASPFFISPASAADGEDTALASSSERLLVTGSSLGGRKGSSPNPVQTITARDIQKTSATSLGDYLSRLPSIGSSGTTNSTTNSGKGAVCTDLRNLGSQRVLVLIDGKRTTLNAGSECVDLNSIPLQQIERVELLKDGGSSLYGADAVAGVINIHLKHDLTTGGITLKGGLSQEGDQRAGQIAAYKGFSLDQGRGNITLFGQYDTTGPIYSRNRDWAALPQNDNPAKGAPSFGSSIIPSGVAFEPGTRKRLVPNGDGTFRAYNASRDAYNFGRNSTIANAHQNAALSLDAHETLSRFITLYGTTRFSRTVASRDMSPAPVQGSVPPSTLPSSWVLPAGNPYNPWGQEASITKRMAELGPRRQSISTNTLTLLGGLHGKLGAHWDYDLSMTYGRSRLAARTANMVNYRHLLNSTGTQALDPTSSSSAVQYNPSLCSSASGCVLQNPFAPYQGKAADYIRFTQKDHAIYQMRDVNFRLRNPHLVSLPYRYGGPIGLSLGMEHRGEQLSYAPDDVVARGDSAGTTGAYTGGGFTVSEGYAETRLPLLQKAPFAHDLSLNLQGRLSAYNRFGLTKNWKIGAHWAPTRDIAFRTTWGTSYRQPDLYSLYSGRTLGYPSASDPCTRATSYGAAASNVIARCRKEQIDPNNFSSAFVGQLPTLSGGNEALRPENGRAFTLGMDLTPRFAPAFHLSVDYWHYSLRHMITTLATQTLLDGCYTGSNPEFCSLIAPRSASNQLTAISAIPQNTGGMKTDGVDMTLNYHLTLTQQDVLSLSENFQYLLSYRQRYSQSGAWHNFTGRMLYLSGSGMPRHRSYTTVTWRHNHFSLTYLVNYTGSLRWNDGTHDLTAATAGRTRTAGIFLQDITLSYQNRQWQANVGINNLFNRRPPFVADGAFNTASSLYSGFIAGRSVFAQAGVTF